jgi:hypothetical protein
VPEVLYGYRRSGNMTVWYRDSTGGYLEGVQRVIVTVNEGFRLEVIPTDNRVYVRNTQVRIDEDPAPHIERQISFNHGSMGHDLKIVDRSDYIPNPHTQKQREKVRELVFSNNAVLRGITYEIIGGTPTDIRQPEER